MIKVKCDACGAPYEVDPRRIPKAGLKMRCPACGASVHVNSAGPLGSPAEPRASTPQQAATAPTELGMPPARVAKPAAAFDLDLPALKTSSPKPAPAPGPGSAFGQPFERTDLMDLPAVKTTSPATRPTGGSTPKSTFGDLDLADLPAPKAAASMAGATAPAKAPVRTALAPDLDFDFDLPAPKKPAALATDLDFDLPALKKPAALAPDLDFDLPALKKSAALAPDLDFDLPAPKRPAALTPDIELDLPAPKRAAGVDARAATSKPLTADFDLDLPVRKSTVLPTVPSPAPARAPQPLAAAQQASTMAKDSLAIDPEPFYADSGSNLLGHLDDIQGAAGREAASSVPAADRFIDLPAPADLPQIKGAPRPGGRPGAGPFGKLAKDSLDLPQGFSDGEIDLPAPIDLPVALDFPVGVPTGTAAAAAVFKKSPLALDKVEAARPQPAAKPPVASPSRKLATDDLAPDFDLQLPEPAGVSKKTAAKEPQGAARISAGDDVLSLPSLSDPPGPALEELPDLDPFVELEAPRRQGMTMEIDPIFEPVKGPKRPGNPAKAQRSGGAGGSAFGELDFGLTGEAVPAQLPVPMPRPVPMDPSKSNLETSAPLGEPSVETAEPAPTKKKKKKKKKGPDKPVAFWVWPLSLVLLLVGAGVFLGLFTPHGWFGVYLVEQMLPAAGDKAKVAAAIEQAERTAKSDVQRDLRKSLVTLSEARNEAGLNRELLARSLLHESLYQLRFGDDMNSAQRAVAILTRVMERGTDVPGLTLARAANATSTGDLATAKSLLAEVPLEKDPYRGLVAGELALLDKQPAAAAEEFEQAVKNGAGARGTWGVARAKIAAQATADAEAASKLTLEANPRHAAALVFIGELALARGDLAEALSYARKATGAEPINGLPARPSRSERGRAFALEGRVEERREHPREAQAAYELALATDPLKLDVLIGSARMLMRLGRARDALTRFDSALGANPSETAAQDGKIPLVEAGVGSAQALLSQERAPEAIERMKALLAKFPENYEVNLWSGHALAAMENMDEAEAAFHKAITIAPQEFGGYVALSQLLFKRERPEEAARTLADATNKVKDSADVRRMLGTSELVRNHLPEAIHQFNAALQFDPKDAGALFGLCQAQRKHGDISAAEQTLARLAGADPLFPGLPLERGQLLETRGDYTGAAAAYQKALEERPQDNDLKLRLGAALVTAGRIDEADALLRQVLKERPTSAEAEHFVGRILFARHDAAQALQRFERAVNFDTMRAEYHMYLGWAHLEQGNLSGALDSVNTALERDPNLADAHWILGRIQLRTGAVKDALESFQRTLRLKPGRVEAIAGMGDAYDQLRELGKAIKSYQDAVKSAPERGDWWYRLGSLHLDKGSRDEARVALAEAVLRGDRLIEKPTWVADAHHAYAEVLRESGRIPEALDQYKTFLQLAPAGHPDCDDATQILRANNR